MAVVAGSVGGWGLIRLSWLCEKQRYENLFSQRESLRYHIGWAKASNDMHAHNAIRLGVLTHTLICWLCVWL